MKDRVYHHSKTNLILLFVVVSNFCTFFINSLYAQSVCTPPEGYYVIDNGKRSEISTTIFNSNTKFYISGTFTVDAFLSLKNKKIIMAPGSKIVVPSLPKAGNINLQITDCDIRGCDGNMWEGIILYERSVLTFSNNTIEDAYHAIKVIGGDDVANKTFLQNVIGNTFHRNYISIWIEKWFAIVGVAWLNTPPYLVNNTFSTDGKPLAKGYFVEDSNYSIGIYGKNVREVIQLGKTENAGKLYPKNTFENLGHGIYLTECDSSIVSIENNTFNNCKTFGVILYKTGDIPAKISNCQFSNSGVGLTIESSPAIVKKCSFKNIQTDTVNYLGGEAMILGNSYFKAYDNDFSNCKTGIQMNGNGEVSTNQFNDVKAAIGVNPNPKGNVRVFDNRIRCSEVGIAVGSSVPVEKVEIDHNNIILDNKGENLLSNGFSKNTAAIWFDGLFENKEEANYFFHHNEIYMNKANYGLYMLASSGVDFSNNTIKALQNDPNGENGIYLGGSSNNLIAANQLSVDTNTVEDPILYLGLNGITLVESPSNTLACNDIFAFGNSMLVSGDCDKSTLKGNKFAQGVNGIAFDASAIIGVQNENGNQWLGSFSNHQVSHPGDEETVKKSLFTVGKSNVTSFLPTSIYLNAAVNMFIETENSNWNNCEEYSRGALFTSAPNGLETIKMFERQTQQNLVSTDFTFDSNWERVIDEVLNTDPSEQNLNNLGYITQSFQDLRKNLESNSTAYKNGLQQFQHETNTIGSEKEFTANRVLNIYAKGTTFGKLQSDELAELVSIANYCPKEYGWSVFAAQSVYHQFTGKLPQVAAQNCTSSKKKLTESNSFTVFPNPANDWMTIEYSSVFDEVQIFDMTGRLVSKIETGNVNEIKVSISAFRSGWYVATLKSADSTKSQKFMIQHQ